MSAAYSNDSLARLLGKERYDADIQRFIREFGENAVVTVDKEDGADDEFIEFKELGFGFYFEGGRLLSVYLHSSKNDASYARYSSPLPMGLSFEQSKSEVVRINGNPIQGGGGETGYFGDVPEWIKYSADGHTVHIEFSTESSSIEMVTLGLR